jgi:predicted nucleic acid-binding protein
MPMYRGGESDPHKIDAQRVLEQAVTANERLVTDAEVLQEILHRYTAIDHRDAIQQAIGALLAVVDGVFPIELPDVEKARDVLLQSHGLSARDAIHMAVMHRRRITNIMTFDRGYSGHPGIRIVSGEARATGWSGLAISRC